MFHSNFFAVPLLAPMKLIVVAPVVSLKTVDFYLTSLSRTVPGNETTSFRCHKQINKVQ